MDDVGDDLQRWAAEARAERGALSRIRQAWLRRRAQEETTWSSLLVDWAEAGRSLLLCTRYGRLVRGRLLAVGADFLVLVEPPRGGQGDAGACPRLVANAAVSWIRPSGAGGEAAAEGGALVAEGAEVAAPAREDPWGTPTGPGLTFAGAMAELAAERARVEVVAGAAPAVHGELRWVGLDVACLEVAGGDGTAGGGGAGDGGGAGALYLPMAAISEVAIPAGSGPRPAPTAAPQPDGSALGSG